MLHRVEAGVVTQHLAELFGVIAKRIDKVVTNIFHISVVVGIDKRMVLAALPVDFDEPCILKDDTALCNTLGTYVVNGSSRAGLPAVL